MRHSGAHYVVIIGGGPAGLAALQWCLELGRTAILLEKDAEFGGQLLHTFNPITNYPGLLVANGRELRDRFIATIGTQRHRIHSVRIVRADLAARSVEDADRKTYTGRTMIIATGVRRRELGIPGEREFVGRGILDSGAKDPAAVDGKNVVIIGGGDAALENAVILSENAAKVCVVHRRDDLTARSEFIERASVASNVEFLTSTRLVSISGERTVENVELEDIRTGRRQSIQTEAVLIRIGVVPNTELFRGQIDLDEEGYAIVNSRCETSITGVLAIGDVVNRDAPTIAAAVGQASIAAKNSTRAVRQLS
jgi:thioredoxin reductase (NADPH)